MAAGPGVNTLVVTTPTTCGLAHRLPVTTTRTGRTTGSVTVFFAIWYTFENTTCVVVASIGTTSVAKSGRSIHPQVK